MRHVGLVHAGPDLHGLGVDHLEERDAGPHLVALVDLAHLPALPDRVQDHEAVDGGPDRHLAGVLVRVPHRAGGPVALDLQDADLGLRGAALQGERLPELGQPRFRLLEGLGVLLGVDAREHLVLAHLEAGGLHVVLGLLQLGLVARAGGALLGLLLPDLLEEVPILRLPVEGGLDLGLAVELDEQIALLDLGSRRHELRDDQRVQARAGQPGGGHGVGPDRFDDPVKPQAAREGPALGGRGARGLRRCRAVSAAASGGSPTQHEKSADDREPPRRRGGEGSSRSAPDVQPSVREGQAPGHDGPVTVLDAAEADLATGYRDSATSAGSALAAAGTGAHFPSGRRWDSALGLASIEAPCRRVQTCVSSAPSSRICAE